MFLFVGNGLQCFRDGTQKDCDAGQEVCKLAGIFRYIHFPNIINSYYCSGVWNHLPSLHYQRGCHGRDWLCDERLLWASQWDLQLLVWNGWVGIVSTLNSFKLHICSCNESKDKVMEIGEGGAGSVRAGGFMLVSLIVIKILV